MLRMLLLLTLFTPWMAGCHSAHSVHPIHEPKEAIAEPTFVGRWVAPDTPLSDGRFRIAEREPGRYQMVSDNPATAERLKDQGKPTEIPLSFCQFGPHFFISGEMVNPMEEKIYLTGRLSVLGDRVYVRSLGNALLEIALQARPKALQHRIDVEVTRLGSTLEHLCVTAPTEEFRAYVLKNVDKKGIWTVASAYDRVEGLPITESGICSRKHRTFNYWWEARCTFQEWRTNGPRTADAIKRVMSNIQNLPTKGVDPEAVECVTNLCKSLEDAAKHITPESKLLEVLQGVYSGLSGKPLRKSFEEMAAADFVVGRLKDSAEQCRKTREILTSRHKLEFPIVE